MSEDIRMSVEENDNGDGDDKRMSQQSNNEVASGSQKSNERVVKRSQK